MKIKRITEESKVTVEFKKTEKSKTLYSLVFKLDSVEVFKFYKTIGAKPEDETEEAQADYMVKLLDSAINIIGEKRYKTIKELYQDNNDDFGLTDLFVVITGKNIEELKELGEKEDSLIPKE